MAKNDDKIKALLGKVEEQRAGLGTKPKAAWTTNGIFKYPDGKFFNINTVKDSRNFVEALSFLLEKESLMSQAAGRLGVPFKEYSLEGYTTSEWEKDFKKRIECVAWDEKKAQLEATEKKLKTLVSEEARTEMELADIESSLKL